MDLVVQRAAIDRAPAAASGTRSFNGTRSGTRRRRRGLASSSPSRSILSFKAAITIITLRAIDASTNRVDETPDANHVVFGCGGQQLHYISGGVRGTISAYYFTMHEYGLSRIYV